MKTKILLLSILTLISTTCFAAAIQKQGIKTLAQCIAGGSTGANCLPGAEQVWDPTNNQQLSVSIANGTLAGAVSLKSDAISNLGLANSVSANALTISLKQKDGSSNPTSSNPVTLSFRDPSSAAGAFNQLNISSALSITIPSGTTIGMISGATHQVFVYALYNGGSPVLALSLSSAFDMGSVQTSTAIAGGSSGIALYSTAGVSNSPIRLIGRLTLTETTAGTYTVVASESSLVPFAVRTQVLSARIDMRAGGSIVQQDGNWISSVSTVSAGQTVVNFVDGVFLTSPNCTAVSHVIQIIPSISGPLGIDDTSPSTSAMRVQAINVASVPADHVMDLTCIRNN